MYCLRLELRSMVFFVILVIPLFNPVAPFLTPNSKACTQNILSIFKCNLFRYFSDIYRYFLIFIDIYIFTAEVEVGCESGGSADEVGVPEAGGAEAAEAGVGGGQPVDYPGLGLVDQVVGHDVGQQPAQRLHTALQHAQSEACFYITGDKYQ